MNVNTRTTAVAALLVIGAVAGIAAAGNILAGDFGIYNYNTDGGLNATAQLEHDSTNSTVTLDVVNDTGGWAALNQSGVLDDGTVDSYKDLDVWLRLETDGGDQTVSSLFVMVDESGIDDTQGNEDYMSLTMENNLASGSDATAPTWLNLRYDNSSNTLNWSTYNVTSGNETDTQIASGSLTVESGNSVNGSDNVGSIALQTRTGPPLNTSFVVYDAFVGQVGYGAPSADFSHSPTSPGVNETVTFNASSSSEPEGENLTYAWDFDGDGVTDSTNETENYTFTSSGDYDVTLTVEDTENKTDSVTKTVSVGSSSSSGSGTGSTAAVIVVLAAVGALVVLGGKDDGR